jgi:predicted metal-dependent phosphoesterase TrpH
MQFRIDLHVHSKYSGDTDSEPEESILKAIELKLDGIAFTEHYSYEASEPVERLKEKYRDAISIFRGVEFSSEEGHCLIFGVNTDTLPITHAPVEEVIRIVNDSGGVLIPSHPYRIGNSLGDIIHRVRGICAVEGYNGCNMHAYNTRAVQAAESLSLPYTGGSDAHAPEEVGMCYTEFYDEVTEANLLSLLKRGRYRGVDNRKRASGSPFSSLRPFFHF